MFLQQLHRYNKRLAILVIAFICIQLFVIIIWGLVISPFYNYGMFSEVMHVNKSYRIFEVEVNGRRLRGQDFSAQQWDKVILPLEYYASINKSNTLYKTDIKRLLEKIHIETSDKNFLQQCNYQQFENWYKKYVATITFTPVHTINITYRLYKFSDTLKPTDSVQHLAHLCH
jgi:hypothetical protein